MGIASPESTLFLQLNPIQIHRAAGKDILGRLAILGQPRLAQQGDNVDIGLLAQLHHHFRHIIGDLPKGDLVTGRLWRRLCRRLTMEPGHHFQCKGLFGLLRGSLLVSLSLQDLDLLV